MNFTTISGPPQKDGRVSHHGGTHSHHHRLIRRGGSDHGMKIGKEMPQRNKYASAKEKNEGAAENSAFRENLGGYLVVGGFALLVLYTSALV